MRRSSFLKMTCIVFIFCVMTAIASLAQTETVLHNFCARIACADGKAPQFVTLVMDAKGNLYGTTQSGGAYGDGTVFRLTASGREEVYSFQKNGTDGYNPQFGLVLDKTGNLYGTTAAGGMYGYGTVFKVTPSGVETILHSFNQNGADGASPQGGLVIDDNGILYGTTSSGGALCPPVGCGTVFEMTPSGVETILYNFANNGKDGMYPSAGLAMDTKGNVYGTTPAGGSYNHGTVFEVTPSGTETILYSFGGNAKDGQNPADAPLVVDMEGNVYGTTTGGGAYNLGTVFQVTPSGVETILHNFGSIATDGQFPSAGLILDAAGNLYGTASTGGPNGEGVVFKMTPSGAETFLYSFPANPTDAEDPSGGLLMDASGNLYGTTLKGGSRCPSSFGCGTVYKLTP